MFERFAFPVARIFLAVHASNGHIERFFSLCRNVYDKQRSVMAEATLEKWMQLSYNGEALGICGEQVDGDSDEEDIADVVVLVP